MVLEVKKMQKRALFGNLLPCLENYRQTHPRTADLDIAVIKKFSSGKTAVQIAMEIPCAEATVYRAANRVDQYLALKTKLCQQQSFQNVEKRKD